MIPMAYLWLISKILLHNHTGCKIKHINLQKCYLDKLLTHQSQSNFKQSNLMSSKALSTLAVYALHLADMTIHLTLYTRVTPKPGLVSGNVCPLPPPWLGFKQQKTQKGSQILTAIDPYVGVGL